MRHIKEAESFRDKGYREFFFDGPVVSHQELGDADHSSFEWDVMVDPILSTFSPTN